MEAIVVEIVVVTYRAARSLRSCLEALRRFTPERSYRLTVVDNGSRDGTARFLRTLPWLPSSSVVALRSNLGFSGAANRAVRDMRAPWVVFLDDDVAVGADWLPRLFGALKEYPRGAILGGRVVGRGTIHSAEIVPWLGAAGAGEPDRGQRSYVRACEAVSGACLAVRRDVLESGVRFDTRFYPCQGEDVDFCLQARRKGFQVVYNGRAPFSHENLQRDMGRGAENSRRLVQKWAFFRDFPAEDSHPVDRWTLEVWRRFSLRDFRGAIPACRRLRRVHPVTAYPDYWLGLAYAAQNDWARARSAWSLSLRARKVLSAPIVADMTAGLQWASSVEGARR